ncbi:MAG: excinuclease ABC subunit C [Candidatus Marinimicrobia bacterium]|nr:excinuclease ABC subunit C [Candidatus Neomarinimicrobiota bacterium]
MMITISKNLTTKLKGIPDLPGVYLFLDKAGKILYIGKSKNLRNRVKSYFHKSSQQSAKIISLMTKVTDFDWIVSESEVEALLTEANLIKEHKPKYNVDLKDDKSFPYIQITKEPYPQVLLTRNVTKDGSKYFGPYTDIKSLRETLKVIHKVFPVRSCSYYLDEKKITNNVISICLDYHINKCEGPCEGRISEDNYNLMIRGIIRFLHGRTSQVIKDLKKKMIQASQEMRYEEATAFRDQMKAVENFTRRQRKVTASFEDKDIIAFAIDGNNSCVVILRLRNGKLIGREKVFLSGADIENMGSTISEFIQQFYLETDFIPDEIIVQEDPDPIEPLILWLSEKRNKKVRINVPQKGEKVRLLRISQKNAELLLGEYLRKKVRMRELIPASVERLKSDLGLSVPPRRIEAFDISNIQGSNPVGSMVCFVDGKPKKRGYRKFKIKSVKGIDDFAMMREVVYRRYNRLKSENAQFPDLILVDGGKGQLGMGVSALQSLGLSYIPVVGLAKRLEEVFLQGFPEPQSIPKGSPGLLLLRRIRDEAHRFAISFHRNMRSKEMTSSIFIEIDGVGPVIHRKLFDRYKTIDEIASCLPPILSIQVHINEKLAKKIIIKAKEYQSSIKPASRMGV